MYFISHKGSCSVCLCSGSEGEALLPLTGPHGSGCQLFRVTQDVSRGNNWIDRHSSWSPHWGEETLVFSCEADEATRGLVVDCCGLTDFYLPDLLARYLERNRKTQSCLKRKNYQNPPNKACGQWASPWRRCGFQMVALGINHFLLCQEKMKMNNNNF